MMPETEVLRVVKSPNATLVALPRRLDGSNSSSVQQRLELELGSDLDAVVLDFSATEFLSSAGVRVLVTLTRRVKQAAGRIRAFGLNPTIRQVFDFSGITSVIAVHKDQKSATERGE